MTTPSKTKSHFEQICFKFMLDGFAKIINKCVSIVSNQYQRIISLSVKNVVAQTSMCLIIKTLHL